ncbi:sulfotransferase family protein [Methylotetracoccus oryzae]|uniref:sulfotransferase family protein n=1 Tax=Methylotetracoccus oryzae TaxID=1919059 RepID=UPI001119699B|nr:sulfotransferase family protein [Methylotetracoccus oryzae]
MSNLWKHFCESAGRYARYVPVETFNYGLNISLKHRYVYVETPKVACSTIKLTLQRLELQDEDFHHEQSADMHKRQYSPLIGPTQVGDLAKFLSRGDLLKFCFVRNPYTRFLSCYLDKIVGNATQKIQILRQLGYDPSSLQTEISFEQFFAAVEAQPISVMDPHWRIQYYQTFQDAITYDFVGRFETFEADFHHIGRLVSPDFQKYYKVEDRHRTSTNVNLTRYYDADLQRRVYERYRKDFDAFGYPFALPCGE